MKFVKRGALAFVPRELLLDAGLVEATAEERAAMERAAAESREREVARAIKLATARTALTALDDPLARLVLHLHSENERGECDGCDFDGYEAERPDWPCRTVEVIAAHHGIELP